ncbi:uncharacterized protein LOC115221371 [Argonauta hians]
MDDSYQQMFNSFRKSRVNRSTIWRRQLKERDPEKYRNYLDQQRIRSQIARNRLKSAISIAKNSPKLITNKYERQRKLNSDKLRAYQWKIDQRSVDARILAKLATNVSQKFEEEPKIVLDKLCDQLKVFKFCHVLTSGLHVSECEVCQKSQHYQNETVELSTRNVSWPDVTPAQPSDDCYVWSRERTELLLRSLTQYFMMKPAHITSVSELWLEISNKMKLLGSNITAVQCQQKWQELKQSYAHLKFSKTTAKGTNQVLPFLSILNMMHQAFQTTTSSLPSSFDSVFTVDLDSSTASTHLYSSCDSSHLISNSFSPHTVLDNYQDVSSVNNNNNINNNDTENVFQEHASSQPDRVWQNSLWNPSVRSEEEEDGSQLVEKNFLKQINLESTAVSRQYWDDDTLEGGSLALPNNFRPIPNGNASVMPSFSDGIGANGRVISLPELSREIKKEAVGYFDEEAVPSISVIERDTEQTWTSEEVSLGLYNVKMEPTTTTTSTSTTTDMYMDIPTPQHLNTVIPSSSSTSSSSSSSSSSSLVAVPPIVTTSTINSSMTSSITTTTTTITTTSTTITSTATATTTPVDSPDICGINSEKCKKSAGLDDLSIVLIETKADCDLDMFCQQEPVLPETISTMCESGSDKDSNSDIPSITKVQNLSSNTNSLKSLQRCPTLQPCLSLPENSNSLPVPVSLSSNSAVSQSCVSFGQNSEIPQQLSANNTAKILDSHLTSSSEELTTKKNADNSENIPVWFQLYIQQCQQQAEVRERQLKDFQTKILDLFKETNQQLAALIETQKTEKMRQEKKDEEFRSNLLGVLQDKLNK